MPICGNRQYELVVEPRRRTETRRAVVRPEETDGGLLLGDGHLHRCSARRTVNPRVAFPLAVYGIHSISDRDMPDVIAVLPWQWRARRSASLTRPRSRQRVATNTSIPRILQILQSLPEPPRRLQQLHQQSRAHRQQRGASNQSAGSPWYGIRAPKRWAKSSPRTKTRGLAIYS